MRNAQLILWCFAMSPWIQTQSNWQLPDASRKYHETCFLTAHNAFSCESDGYIQPQQKLSLEQQLAYGVRGFMLDTHYERHRKKIRLCHGSYRLTRMMLRPFNGQPMSLRKGLLIFKQFLIQHPQEIVTLFLENYTDGKHLDEVIEKSHICDLILKPSDYDISNGWPTISWMQRHNKRLVIFNQKGATSYIFDEWTSHTENQYGTTLSRRCLSERQESKKQSHPRHLFVFNYFPHFYIKPLQCINFEHINGPYLERALMGCLQQGLHNKSCYRERCPNFIALDFVHIGKGLDIVNAINTGANNRERRKRMFNALS